MVIECKCSTCLVYVTFTRCPYRLQQHTPTRLTVKRRQAPRQASNNSITVNSKHVFLEKKNITRGSIIQSPTVNCRQITLNVRREDSIDSITVNSKHIL